MFIFQKGHGAEEIWGISLGLARTGKLVTSAALVLMFAFFVLSASPGTDIKQFRDRPSPLPERGRPQLETGS